MLTKILHLKVSALILAILTICVNSEAEFTYYGKMGPDHWSEHYNQCSGKHQSPININDVDVVNRTFSEMLFNDFQKLPLNTSISNNGHTVLVQMLFDQQVPTISNGPLEGRGLYQFQQLHFHWGEDNTVGSEDRINDIAYPMELHIVFRNSKYESFEVAARANDGIVVLAAFYEVVNYTNNDYEHFTSHLVHIQEPHTNVTLAHPLNLFSLLRIDLNKYYTYVGSLTTPPCSEDVIWIDFVNPIGISAEMIERFRYLKTFDGSPLTHNFRPVQPLNNRKIYRSVVNDDKDSDGPSARGILDVTHMAFIDIKSSSSSDNLKMHYSHLIQVFSALIVIRNLY